MSNQIEIICKNIFKNGNENTTIDAYTQIWTELINQLEQRAYEINTGILSIDPDTLFCHSKKGDKT